MLEEMAGNESDAVVGRGHPKVFNIMNRSVWANGGRQTQEAGPGSTGSSSKSP